MFAKRSAPFLAAAFVVLALGADDETVSHKVKGVEFSTPKSWDEGKASEMRAAQFKIKAAEGDDDPADLILYVFRGGGGTLKGNLDRWSGQFLDKDGKAAKVTTEERKGKDTAATLATASGRYVAAISPMRPDVKYDKPGWMMLVAVVQTDENGYYFKLVGPEKTVKAAKPAFEEMIKSISVGAK